MQSLSTALKFEKNLNICTLSTLTWFLKSNLTGFIIWQKSFRNYCAKVEQTATKSNNRSISVKEKLGGERDQERRLPRLEQECDLSLSFVLSSSFVSLLEKRCVEELLL